MNFLAHLYLADRTPDSIVGNMLGDFVDGEYREQFPASIANGIFLHREVDKFTDAHPVFQKSRKRIDDKFRHLKGIMVDVFYDHFLARNWKNYSDEALPEFCQYVYRIFEEHQDIVPARLRRIFPWMITDNWLLAYREIEGISKALTGLSGRLSRKNSLGESVTELELHYDDFESDFEEFFPRLIEFTQIVKQQF